MADEQAAVPNNDRTQWEVTPEEVARLCSGDAPPLLLDCRTADELDIAAIEGAMHIPVQEISLRIDEIRGRCDETIIVFCHSGNRSYVVTRLLAAIGFTRVRSMAGGIDRWSAEVDPAIPTY